MNFTRTKVAASAGNLKCIGLPEYFQTYHFKRMNKINKCNDKSIRFQCCFQWNICEKYPITLHTHTHTHTRAQRKKYWEEDNRVHEAPAIVDLETLYIYICIAICRIIWFVALNSTAASKGYFGTTSLNIIPKWANTAISLKMELFWYIMSM